MGLTEAQVIEYVKCKLSVVYFACNYVWIRQDETGDIVPFNPLPYRLKMLAMLQRGDNLLSDKCRRAGASWTDQTHSAWVINFHKARRCLNLSRSEDDAIDLLDKARFVLNNLAYHDAPSLEEATPADFLRQEFVIDNMTTLAIGWQDDRGRRVSVSRIDSLTTTTESGRSRGAAKITLDEWGFVKPDDERTWKAIRPTILRGGQSHEISCVTADTYVFTSDGVMQMSDYIPPGLKPGQFADMPEKMVFGRYGPKPCKVVYSSGMSPIKEIKTQFGYKLCCTHVHPILVGRDGSIDWVRAEEIEIGDWIPISRGMQLWGKNVDLSDCKPEYAAGFTYRHRGKDNKWICPDEITEDLAYLLGLITGDGYLHKNGVVITTTDQEIVDWLLENGCGLNFKKEKDGIHIRACSRPFIEFCRKFGLSYNKRAPKKTVPKRIMMAPKRIVTAFLQGLFDADGCATKRGLVSFVTSSETLAYQVHALLLNFGIVGTLYPKTSKPTKRVKVESKQWVIEIGLAAREFFQEIGFRLTRKQKRGEINFSKKRSLRDGIPFAHRLVREIREGLPRIKDSNLGKLRRRISNDVLEKMPEKTSYQSLRSILEMYSEASFLGGPNQAAFQSLTELVQANYFWVKVTSISDGRDETYDFSIPDGHSFISSGFVSHNTPNGVGGIYHRRCVQARLGRNKGYSYLPIDWWDTEITPEQFETLTDDMTQDDIDEEFGRKFLQTGSAAFDADLLAAAYKPLDEHPEIAAELAAYKSRLAQGTAIYYGGIDSKGWSKRGRKKVSDYNAMGCLTDNGILAGVIHNQHSVARWSGYQAADGDGQDIWIEGDTSRFHARFPGIYYCEQQAGGQVVLTNHRSPQDSRSSLVPFYTSNKSKSAAVNAFRLALEGFQVTITDRRVYEELLLLEDLGQGRYEAPAGYNDDLAIMMILAWMALLKHGVEIHAWGIGAGRDAQENRPEIIRKATPLDLARLAPQGPRWEARGQANPDSIYFDDLPAPWIEGEEPEEGLLPEPEADLRRIFGLDGLDMETEGEF